MAILGPLFSRYGPQTLMRPSLIFSLLALIWSSLLWDAACIYAKGPNEAVIKAAFIYNFTKFVTWPEESSNGEYLLIGILEADPVSQNLQMLEGRKSGGKVIKIVKLDGDMASAHVNLLYLPDISKLTSEDLNFLRQRHILLVTDGKESVTKGAIIALYRKQNRIRFDINLHAAKGSGIGLSSKLLNLAGRVIK